MRQSGPTTTGRRARVALLVVAALLVGGMFGPPIASAATRGAKSVTVVGDPSTNAKAHVSAKGRILTSTCDANDCAAVDAGRLRVGDGSGPLTVDGTVTAYPYPPSKVFSEYFDVLDSGTQVFVRKGHRVALTSITLDNSSGNSAELSIYHLTGGNAQCAGGLFDTRFWSGRSNTTTNETMSFPTPLIVDDKCAQLTESLGDTYVHVTITGYLLD